MTPMKVCEINAQFLHSLVVEQSGLMSLLCLLGKEVFLHLLNVADLLGCQEILQLLIQILLILSLIMKIESKLLLLNALLIGSAGLVHSNSTSSLFLICSSVRRMSRLSGFIFIGAVVWSSTRDRFTLWNVGVNRIFLLVSE